MADAVSKLYAEIGFKVNQDGLKQLQSVLKDLTKQMNNINKATKEAARQFGVFSKDQAKQEIHNARMATEASRKAVQDKRIQIMEIRELDRQNDRAKREKEKEERNALREQEKAEKRQQREADKAARERRKRLKDTLNTFKSFGVGLRNTFLSLAGLGAGAVTVGVKQSLDRSIATRDFMLQTGVGLKQLQNLVGGFANIGSGMSQQQLMGDIVSVSQNLQEIALGKGNLAPYKLLGLAARRGDVMGVISEAGRAIQGLDNPMALNLLKQIGLSSDWLSYFRLQQKEGGSKEFIDTEGQSAIVEAKTSLRQVSVAFKNLSDRITAEASPAIEGLATSAVTAMDAFTRYIKDSNFGEGLKKISDDIKQNQDDLKQLLDGILFIPKLLGKIFHYAGFAWGYMTGNGYAEEDKENRKKYGVESDFYKKGQEIAKRKYQNMIENAKNGTVGRDRVVYVDQKTMNNTFNGVENEDMAEKVEEVMEKNGYKTNRDVKRESLNMATDLTVLVGGV